MLRKLWISEHFGFQIGMFNLYYVMHPLPSIFAMRKIARDHMKGSTWSEYVNTSAIHPTCSASSSLLVMTVNKWDHLKNWLWFTFSVWNINKQKTHSQAAWTLVLLETTWFREKTRMAEEWICSLEERTTHETGCQSQVKTTRQSVGRKFNVLVSPQAGPALGGRLSPVSKAFYVVFFQVFLWAWQHHSCPPEEPWELSRNVPAALLCHIHECLSKGLGNPVGPFWVQTPSRGVLFRAVVGLWAQPGIPGTECLS